MLERHKVEELRAIMGPLGVRIVGLKELPGWEGFTEPAETGDTFEENATIKALGYAAQTGRVCLADDSGLEIDALGGRPGVISSHYCTNGEEMGMSRAQRDAANNARVMKEMEGVPEGRRGARFVCVMVVAKAGKVLAVSRGTFEGVIGVPPVVPRGENGFGYDPLLLVGPDYRRTSAELPAEEKNRLSHRGKAARGMIAKLKALRG